MLQTSMLTTSTIFRGVCLRWKTVLQAKCDTFLRRVSCIPTRQSLPKRNKIISNKVNEVQQNAKRRLHHRGVNRIVNSLFCCTQWKHNLQLSGRKVNTTRPGRTGHLPSNGSGYMAQRMGRFALENPEMLVYSVAQVIRKVKLRSNSCIGIRIW